VKFGRGGRPAQAAAQSLDGQFKSMALAQQPAGARSGCGANADLRQARGPDAGPCQVHERVEHKRVIGERLRLHLARSGGIDAGRRRFIPGLARDRRRSEHVAGLVPAIARSTEQG
jgi:hypothetical protein